MTNLPYRLLVVLLAAVLLAGPSGVGGVAPARADEPEEADHTPPRLGFVEGEVSFWRPGAEDWAPAQVNTPLAPGDELHTGYRGNFELQLDGQSFVRAWGDTHLGLTDQRAGILQLRVTAGHVALDLRRVEPGTTIEIDAPHGALVLAAPGYYRVDVGPQRTAFTLRRDARATLALASGATLPVGANEQVVLDGAAVQRAAAPALDVWDTWNETRTAHLLAPASARYVPAGVAGAADLDRHGAWRVEPSYGAVWVPGGVPEGWAPYSSGRWVADPHYGWTWVDTAPWGWAPYHYGRWVHLGGVWAWAPGPVVTRPVYAPALVAFFGSPAVTVGVATPFLSWVALGWGEPVVPWWRTSRFHGRPWWGGWGGPRVVNNVIVHRTTVIDAHRITDYRNARIRRAVVGVRKDSFGRRGVHEVRLADADLRDRRPIHGRLDVRPDRSSFVAADGPGRRPAEETRTRPVVTRREPRRVDPAATPRPGTPRVDRPRGQTPGAETPRRGETPRAETPRAETPHTERPRSAPPGGERPGVETPRSGTPRVERPRPESPRPAGPAYGDDARVPGRAPRPGATPETPRREPPEPREPRRPAVEPPRPAQPEGPAAPAPRVERPAQPERPRAVQPERRVEPPRPAQPERPAAPAPRVERPAQPERPRAAQPERRVEPPRPAQPEGPAAPAPRVERPAQPERPRAVQPERRVEPPRPAPRPAAPPREAPARDAGPGGERVGQGRMAEPPRARPATPATRRAPQPRPAGVDRARATRPPAAPAARPQPGPGRGERARESSGTRPGR